MIGNPLHGTKALKNDLALEKDERKSSKFSMKRICLIVSSVVFISAIVDMIVYNFSDKHFAVHNARLTLEGDDVDAALRASASMKLTSLFHSYDVSNGHCQLFYSDGENSLRPIGDIHGNVDRVRRYSDEVKLSFTLTNTEYTKLRRLLWDVYAGGSPQNKAKIECSAMGTVHLFHAIPVSLTVKPSFELLGPNQMYFSDKFNLENPEGGNSLIQTLKNAFDAIQDTVKVEHVNQKQVKFSLSKQFENVMDAAPFPVSSFVVSIPELSYDLSTLEDNQHTRLLLSNVPSDVNLVSQESSLVSTFSLSCAEFDGGGDGDGTGDMAAGGESCTLVDSLHLDRVLKNIREGHLHMTASSRSPNFISGIVGADHYISGHKYQPENAVADRGRYLREMISPSDPDVSDSGVDCIAVDGDNVYDSVLCLNVAKGFVKTYLDVSDEDGVMSVMQGVTAWALEGGVAFTTDIATSARGGYVALMNVSASEDYRNASMLFSYADNGEEKVYTNVFTEWETGDGGKEADVHYYIQFNESFDVPGGFLSWGDFSYDSSQYDLHINQNVDMNHASYEMSLYGAGGYGGSWSNWFWTLQESSLTVDGTLEGGAVAALGAAIPSSGKRGSIELQSTVVNGDGVEQQYTTNNAVWYSPDGSWSRSGSMTLDSTFRVDGLNWDTHDSFVYDDNTFTGQINNADLSGVENFYAAAVGRYGGDVYNWHMRVDNSQVRVDGDTKGSAIGEYHSFISNGGSIGDIKCYTNVVDGSGGLVMKVDNTGEWVTDATTGYMELNSLMNIVDVVNWDIQDIFAYGFDGQVYASMSNKDLEGTEYFSSYGLGEYNYSPTYGYIELLESDLVVNGVDKGGAISLFEVEAHKNDGQAFFGIYTDDSKSETMYLDLRPAWGFNSASYGGLIFESTLDVIDTSTNWEIEDSFIYDDGEWSLGISNKDSSGNPRVDITGSGTYGGSLQDWVATLDESEVWLDDDYKGAATGRLVSQVPGSVGKIRLKLVAVDDKNIQQMYTDSTGKWDSTDWYTEGDVDFVSFMVMNTCLSSNCADLSWNIHDVFSYADKVYFASMENKNIKGSEIVFANATGRFGGGSVSQWWATVDDSTLRLNTIYQGQAVGLISARIGSTQALIEMNMLATNPNGDEQAYVNTTAKWYTESAWTRWGNIEYKNIMRFHDPYSNTYLGCYYRVKGDRRAQETFVECPIIACEGDEIIADLCAKGAQCQGDPYLRLFLNGTEVESNDDHCGLCSKIKYTYPGPGCVNLSLHEGCYNSRACEGEPMITAPSSPYPSYSFFVDSSVEFSYGDNVYSMQGSFRDQNDQEKVFAMAQGKYGGSSFYKWYGTADFMTYRYESAGPGDMSGELSVDIDESWERAGMYFSMITYIRNSSLARIEYYNSINQLEWDGRTSLISANVYSETTAKKEPRFLLTSTLEIDDDSKQAVFTLIDVMKDTEQVNCDATAWYDTATGMMTGVDMDVLWKQDLLFNAHMFVDAQTEAIVNPTMQPTTSNPSLSPTVSPTALPTVAPTASPTNSPTIAPTVPPSAMPSPIPSLVPTSLPSLAPVTSRPTLPGETNAPTASPTSTPTSSPTASPTAAPTVPPTTAPTARPSFSPTASPTSTPTSSPTASPTSTPTVAPTVPPTTAPTARPSVSPTASPTSTPTSSPTASPTSTPTVAPTFIPTVSPTFAPSLHPTQSPTAVPTSSPSALPTEYVPLQTVVSFDTNEIMDGVSAADFDQAAKDAFLQVTADSMNGVSVGDLTFVSVTDTSVAMVTATSGTKHLRENKIIRTLETSSATLVFTTQVVMEDYEGQYSDPYVMVDDLEDQLATSYADPATAQKWKDLSVAGGSTTINSNTSAVFQEPVLSTVTVDVVKTGFPTPSPTPSADTRSSGSDDDDTTETLTIALAVSGAVVVIVVLVAVYFVKKRCDSNGASDEEIIVSDNTTKGTSRLGKRGSSSDQPGASAVGGASPQDDVISTSNPIIEKRSRSRTSTNKAGSLGNDDL